MLKEGCEGIRVDALEYLKPRIIKMANERGGTRKWHDAGRNNRLQVWYRLAIALPPQDSCPILMLARPSILSRWPTTICHGVFKNENVKKRFPFSVNSRAKARSSL